MYQGTLATLARDVPYSLIFFPLYANIKALLADSKGNNSMISVLFSGVTAGAVAAGAVTPTDVVKTRWDLWNTVIDRELICLRLQLAGGKERYGSMLNTYMMILREEGFSALYKGNIISFWNAYFNQKVGAVPRMVVVGPLFGITLLAFEFQKEYMIKKGLL